MIVIILLAPFDRDYKVTQKISLPKFQLRMPHEAEIRV